MKVGDRITRKDGKWAKKRFATLIAEPNEDGEIMARFGTRGKYFGGYAKNYIVIKPSLPAPIHGNEEKR